MRVKTILSGTLRAADRVLSTTAVAAVRLYQLTVSPALSLLMAPGGGCRFHPTCSQYAVECLRSHSFPRAVVLIVRRVGKCHPFHPGGMDPVPATRT